MAYIISSGESSSGIILENDSMTVLDGGIADSTTVNSMGRLHVSMAGAANSTTVNSRGLLNISSGGTATHNIVNSYGSVNVFRGGTASDTVINSSGAFLVPSGGTAVGATVNPGGVLSVFSQGTATEIKENGGYVQAEKGAVVTFVSNTFVGLSVKNSSATVHSGTTAINARIGSGSLMVYSGGLAEGTEVGRTLYVSGGTARDTMVGSVGSVFVSSGGTAIRTTLISAGKMDVFKGGIANETVASDGGWLRISEGGVANGIVNTFADVGVLSGGRAYDVVNIGGGMTVGTGGSASNVTLEGRMSADQTGRAYTRGASLIISSGAKVSGVTVGKSAGLTVVAGGTAMQVREDGGYVTVSGVNNVTFVPNSFGSCTVAAATLHSGTTATDVQFSELRIYQGGLAQNTSAVASGSMHISSGGTATGTRLFGTCSLVVSNGGTATDTTLSYYFTGMSRIENASMTVSRGGTASGVTVKGLGNETLSYGISGGVLTLDGGRVNDANINLGFFLVRSGVASNTTLNGHVQIAGDDIQWGTMKLFAGSAYGTTVNRGGVLEISGGIAADIVENGGYVNVIGGTATFASNTFSGLLLAKQKDVEYKETAGVSATVHSGTTAVDVTVADSCLLEVFSGGKLTGRITGLGGSISAGMDAIVNYDLTQIAPGAAARINDLSCISGSPVYTLTIGADQAEGLYALAENASSFKGTITVMNTLGDELGTLTVGETTDISGVGYSLMLSDSALSLRIGTTDTPSPYTSEGLVLTSSAVVVENGRTYRDTTLLDSAKLDVSSGGSADKVTVYDTGKLTVFSGGKAVTVVENGGYVDVQSGADVTFAQNVIRNAVLNGSVSLHSGTTAYNTRLGGSLFIYSGGVAEGVMNKSEVRTIGLTVSVFSGGTANNVELLNGACSMTVDKGGVANRTSVGYYWNERPAVFNVLGGGRANDTLVYGGSMAVASKGLADRVVAAAGGVVSIERGGSAQQVTVNAGGKLQVFGSGSAVDVIENGGCVVVSQGADVRFLSNTFSGVELYGGTATLHSGTTAVGMNVYHSAYYRTDGLYVSNGGSAVGTIVGSNGNLFVSSGGVIDDTTVGSTGRLFVSSGGTANNTTVFGSMTVSHGVVNGVSVTSRGALSFTGGKLTGRVSFNNPYSALRMNMDAVLDFDLTQTEAGAAALVSDLAVINGSPIYTLTVSGSEAYGMYLLADQAAHFDGTISVVNTAGDELGTLTVGGGTLTIGETEYTLNIDDELLSVTLDAAPKPPEPPTTLVVRGDRDGNGVSDVMFVWTGKNYAHGYWMNGTSEWWSANSTGVSADWDNLGSYDMSGDGKADAVMFGNVVVNDAKGAYIGYYQDGDDANGWVNIGFLDNSQNNTWKNAVGNLTGGNANSIVWYAPELYALGAWTDGTDTWVTLSNTFGGAEWTLVGCGDFDGDGADSVVMTYNNGQMFYTADLDGATASLGDLNWSGWEVRAIGDFAGDGKDDIVLFHAETGSLVMLADGCADDYESIGQLDPNDWFVAGCGDYNGDGSDDLLVRQYSTGMLGYYSNGDTTEWIELGRGVDMDWTVIA